MPSDRKFVVFVVGPIFGINRTIALEICRWVGCPRLFIKDILGGLRTPLVETGRSSTSSAAAAEQVVDDVVANKDQLACMALRILFAQAESLFKDWIHDGGLVLEFTAGPGELPTVDSLFEVMKIKIKSVDRGLIIHYPSLPSDSSEDSNDSDSHSYADVREAIHRQLLCSLSLSLDKQQEQLQLEKSSFINYGGRVLKFEIDLTYDWTAFAETSYPRSSGEKPSIHFYQAIDYMLFEHNLKEEAVPLSITMRQWPKIRLDLHRHRYGHGLLTDWEKTSLCFKGFDDHYLILITFEDDEDKCNNNIEARMCRLCDKSVAADTAAASFDSTSHDVRVCYYSCAFCPLYLHKHCAELKDHDQDSFTPLLLDRYSDSNWFNHVVKHTCKIDQDGGEKDFSPYCKACLFDTVLKSLL